MSDVTAAPAAPGATPGLEPASQRGDNKRRLGDVIVELGFADRERVEAAVAEAREDGRRTGQVLLDSGVVDSRQLARALAERNGLDYVDLSLFEVDKGAATLITPTRLAATARSRSRSSRIARSSPRPPTRPTCSASTTSRWRPATRSAPPSAPPEHVEATDPPARPPQRLGPRDRGGGARGGGRANRLELRESAEEATGRQARPLGDRRRGRARRLGHPLRSQRRRDAGSAAHRRRRPGLDHGPAATRAGARVEDQDHGRARHRRAPPAPGRPHRPDHRRALRRPARRDPSGDARRVGRDANPRQGPGRHGPRQPRDRRRRPRA